jgi:hypothetical protein
MLDLNSSRITHTYSAKLSSTVTKVPEGVALVRVMEGGEGLVKPATGAAGEVFDGIALSQVQTPDVLTFGEIIKVPSTAPYTVTLTKTPVNSDVGLYIN